jgi:hypothetical protein
MARESITEFLSEQSGYITEGNKIIRPDGSIAIENGSAYITEQEMIKFQIHSGRGIPSMMGGDLTNMGASGTKAIAPQENTTPILSRDNTPNYSKLEQNLLYTMFRFQRNS